MRVAIIQFEPVRADRSATMERLAPLLERAASAELVVLPELASTGYLFADAEEAARLAEEIPDGPFTRWLIDEAARRRQHIVTGIAERSGGTLFNSAVLVGPGGHLATYRKIHLFDREKLIFQPGDEISPVVDIGGCRVGMAVCFDWMFPEIWRSHLLRGVDVVCHPSNLVLPGACQRAMPVRAMTNRYYTLTANRIGREDDLVFTGRSLACDPRGRVIAEAGPEEETVLLLDMAPEDARDKRVTPRNDVLRDRRPDLYGLLTEEGIQPPVGGGDPEIPSD